MKTLTSLALLLTSLTVLIDGNSPSKQKSSGAVELVRRRGGLGPPVRMVQRGRKRTIWSYNPGHRSLAFLVAGEVDTVSPPPVNPGTGDYHCLGCCGNKVTTPGEATAAPKISNRVNRILYPPEGIADLGTEPNSINDRCLGCCEESVTPSLRVTPTTGGRSTQRQVQRGAPTRPQKGAPTGPQKGAPTGPQGGAPTRPQGGAPTGPQRGAPTGPQGGAPTRPQGGAPTGPQRGATAGRQGLRQTQQGGAYKPVPPPCTPPKCNPDWRYESSSSSEEMPVMRRQRARSRLQTVQLRSDTRCRHLGCRSALGLGGAPDDSDSSSSEED